MFVRTVVRSVEGLRYPAPRWVHFCRYESRGQKMLDCVFAAQNFPGTDVCVPYVMCEPNSDLTVDFDDGVRWCHVVDVPLNPMMQDVRVDHTRSRN